MMGNFKKKHIGTVEEFSIHHIGEYIRGAQDTFEQMQKDRERMKEIEMTKRTTAELLGRMFIEDEIITSTQLGIIKRELIKPTFDYMAKDSLWEVYNHATYAFKEEHPALWLKRHIGLHDYIMNKEIGQSEVMDIDFSILSPEEALENVI